MTNQVNKVKVMVIAALLSAIGIIIPMFAPKIMIEPASFTLASHVPVMIAMFISPAVAVFVALITSFGFLLAGFPMVIVLRALTHLIFVTIGAYMLKKNGNLLQTPKTAIPFGLFISVIHAFAEVVIVSIYYWGGDMTAYESKGYLVSVIGLIGFGSIIHSMIDFSIATMVWKPLQYVVSIPANAKIRTK